MPKQKPPAQPADGLLIGTFGAKGTGKTAWALQQLKAAKPGRLLVWDHKHDPRMATLWTPQTAMTDLIAAARRPRFQLRYLPDHGKDVQVQFDIFCRLAFELGNLTMVIDELPEVTKASRAPAAWRKCVNVGRLYSGPDGKMRSLNIVGIGQRPSECDKSFMNNLDVCHTGRIGQRSDADTLADLMNVNRDEIMALPNLGWIERRAGSPEVLRGTLKFR